MGMSSAEGCCGELWSFVAELKADAFLNSVQLNIFKVSDCSANCLIESSFMKTKAQNIPLINDIRAIRKCIVIKVTDTRRHHISFRLHHLLRWHWNIVSVLARICLDVPFSGTGDGIKFILQQTVLNRKRTSNWKETARKKQKSFFFVAASAFRGFFHSISRLGLTHLFFFPPFLRRRHLIFISSISGNRIRSGFAFLMLFGERDERWR